MFTDTLFPEEKFAVIRVSGAVEAAEITGWIEQLIGRSDFAPDFDGVIDFREARLNLDLDDLPRIAGLVASHQVTGRWAHLVSQPTETALITIYRRQATLTHPVALFSTLRGASRYLGRDLLRYFTDDGLY